MDIIYNNSSFYTRVCVELFFLSCVQICEIRIFTQIYTVHIKCKGEFDKCYIIFLKNKVKNFINFINFINS